MVDVEKKTKYLINSSDPVVDLLNGVVAINPELRLYAEPKVVTLKKIEKKRVHLISGGGSGHEPFAAGYVGRGMLSAAVAGPIFTSPPSSCIQCAIRTLCQDSSISVLVIIANYTGDVLNFGIACEKARNVGHKVDSIIVGEDCALQSVGRTSLAGRRGMCGIIFVIKIAGAMAEEGKSLEQIVKEAKEVSSNISTLGVCLEPCSIPGNSPMFKLDANEVDLGLGIHGEAGIKRIKMLSAKEATEILLQTICSSLNIEVTDEVCVLVNNLGSLSQLEMCIIQNEVVAYFAARQIKIQRMYSGSFMTSLDMKGLQISILMLKNDSWVSYLSSPTSAPGWSGASETQNLNVSQQKVDELITTPEKIIHWDGEIQANIFPGYEDAKEKIMLGASYDVEKVKASLRDIAEKIKTNEQILNELDTICGDGDCGSTLSKMADGLLYYSENKHCADPVTLLLGLESWADKKMGGTSGALYSLMFFSAASSIVKNKTLNWKNAFIAAVDGVMKCTPARIGDRTMMDVLIPCKEILESNSKQNWEKVKEDLRKCCEQTKNLVPKAGRASNVNSELINKPDAGAMGVYLWITSILETFELISR